MSTAHFSFAPAGLKSGQALRTQAEAAVAQVRDANPEAQRVAMVVMPGLFKTTGLQDLNAFRTELLKPGADGAVSDLEARLSGRFRDMGLQTIAGSPMIAFCKAQLLSQENANELLNDRPDGWTGRIKDAVASRLGLSLEPAAPKAVTEMPAREAIATGLSARMAGLLPGQSFELRAAESGEVELTIPTTLPGVDATAGFSMGRDSGVLVRVEANVTALRNSDVQSQMLDRRVGRLRESTADRRWQPKIRIRPLNS